MATLLAEWEVPEFVYAVIFRAEMNDPDEDYFETASRMRELALNDYGCLEFSSCCEGGSEIAISYWPSRQHIQAWKNNPEHQNAQSLGKTRWYKSYHVQLVEILAEYGSST